MFDHSKVDEMMSLDLFAPVTMENFDEVAYLESNSDVKAAMKAGHIRSGREHFIAFGRHENRLIAPPSETIRSVRRAKMDRLRPFLRRDMLCVWEDGKADFLTAELRAATRISPTDVVSSNDYDAEGMSLIEACSSGLVLDCGAGSRKVYHENVVNYEIVNYPSTDVMGVGEKLPFLDNTFDGAISVAVLEHVRDPITCAREISRVLKPGGTLYCAIPFLQPYHGYPHHYFNATPQGARRLFEDELDVESVTVIRSTHPIWGLNWMLSSWRDGLPPKIRKDFLTMTVEQLLRSPNALVGQPFCTSLPMETQLEIACATVLKARKR